jgi:hypothetical protein
MHVSQRFRSVTALRSVLWHELGDAVPDEGEFNVGYFKGQEYSKKRPVTCQDLDVMYSYKPCLNLWCDDSKDQEEDMDEETVPQKKPKKGSK